MLKRLRESFAELIKPVVTKEVQRQLLATQAATQKLIEEEVKKLRPKADPWWKDYSKVILAVCGICNITVAFLMFGVTTRNSDVTRRIFETSYRPYVGVVSVSAFLDRTNKVMTLNVEWKNLGSIPAINVKAEWAVFIDGVRVPSSKIPDEPIVMLPSDHHFFAGSIRSSSYDDVVSGKSKVEISVDINYEGPSGQAYRTTTKHRYAHELNNFIGLGGALR
jgi:hypothetical protein